MRARWRDERERERRPLARKRRVAAETGTGQGQSVSRQGGPERGEAMTQYHSRSSACRHQSHFTARSVNAFPFIFAIVILSYNS